LIDQLRDDAVEAAAARGRDAVAVEALQGRVAALEAAARDADDRVASTAVWKSTSVSGATPSSRRRVDGVEDDANARKILIFTQVDGRRTGARRAPAARRGPRTR
jgi:hypothetical protein